MLGPTAPAPLTTRLRVLLERCTSGLNDEVVAEARSAGPELAGDVVVQLLEAELSHPSADRTALRAAHLAHELQLTRAVPALVRCLENLPDLHPLRGAALTTVAHLGTAAVDALLAAFDRCGSPEARARIAEALSRTGVKDDRIRDAFVRMLEDDPVNGAQHLAEYGEWRAVADLLRTVDRLGHASAGDCDCDLCASERLLAIASAIRELGGTLTEEQRAKLEAVQARAATMWTPFEAPTDLPAAFQLRAVRDPRPGRNDPCPCGSGKKYKRCHLEVDERARN